MPYNWPSKIKKYGITCPFQRFLVAKYENQIDWNGDHITTPGTLDRHIRERLLPALHRRIEASSERSNYCLAINLDNMLANPAPHLDKARQIRHSKGADAATKFLLDHINSQKKTVFESWWTYVMQENPVYQSVPACRRVEAHGGAHAESASRSVSSAESVGANPNRRQTASQDRICRSECA